MTPPQPGDSGTSGPNGSHEPVPPPSLPDLRDYKSRLSGLLEDIEISPDSLDVQASQVHDGLVLPTYKLMCTEVAQACGSQWGQDSRRRFRQCFSRVADKWPAYRRALEELQSARNHSRSQVAATVRLERPRREYVDELARFYGEFSETLDFLFPP